MIEVRDLKLGLTRRRREGEDTTFQFERLSELLTEMSTLSQSSEGSLALHLKVLHEDLSKWLSKRKDDQVKREARYPSATKMTQDPSKDQQRRIGPVAEPKLVQGGHSLPVPPPPTIESLKRELERMEQEVQAKRLVEAERRRLQAASGLTLSEMASQLNSSHVPSAHSHKSDRRPSISSSSSFAHRETSSPELSERPAEKKGKGWKKLKSMLFS